MKNVRDATLSAAAYRGFIKRYEGHVRHVLSLGEPTLFDEAAKYTLEIASALYSAGAPVPDCHRRLDEMATYDFRYIAEGRKYTFVGIGSIDNRFVERFPAAHLVGRAGELVAAHRRCTFQYPPQPWEEALITPICSVLAGDPVEADDADEATIGRAIEYFALVPRLCKTVADRDATAFASTLKEFLNDGWGPLIERRAKLVLKEKPPDYSGKWSYLAAALCRIMGGVPAVPAKAMRYIPVELVTA
jgi:hypothetical protein